LLAAFGLIYLPAAGHGFIKDDFGWIAQSSVASWSDAAGLLGSPTGFFRPIVSLSFGVNRWLCGLQPLCYGLTNVALAVACGAAVFILARGLSLPAGAALLASALWIFNWHGINMATLWISGRTALMVVLFAVSAAAAFVRRRFTLAVLLSLGAMLAKEEGVLLPAILLAWMLASRRWPRGAGAVRFVVGSAAAEALYLSLRANSGAFTLGSAPPFYHLSFTVQRLVENLPGYFDRTATFTLVVLLVAGFMCRPRRSALARTDPAILLFGGIWWAGSLGVTLFLPVRSSLYACLPSVGTALIGAAVISAAWPAIDVERQRRAVWAGLAMPFVLWPVFVVRNRPSVREAELSSRTIRVLEEVARQRGAGAVVLFKDDRAARPSLETAFGTMLPVAVNLMVAPRVSAWIDPPPVDAPLAGLRQPAHFDVQYALRDGQLVKIP
jgi:hypothetical protein